MLEELKKTLENSPIIKKGDYDYFINPISDGIPAMDPKILRELSLAVYKYADLDIDKIVAVEAMGIHNDLHAGEKILLIDDVVSTGGTLIALLKTLKDLGLEVKSTVAVIDKGKGKEIVERETGVNVFSIVKVDIIDGKVVIEKTIED